MAIDISQKYPGKSVPASAGYPFGSAQNITAPGDQTGTPLEADWLNDLFGFQQAILSRTGRTPTGAPDTATDSQYLEALVDLTAGYADAQALRDAGAPAVSGGSAVIRGAGGGVFDHVDASIFADTGTDAPGMFVSDGAGAGWQRRYSGAIRLEWFGAVGDYNEAVETPGRVAAEATNNYPPLLLAKAALLAAGGGVLRVSKDTAGGNYYFSNATKLDMNDIHVLVETGVVWRCETPSSIGGTLTVGGYGLRNISVSGGGKVQNHMQDPANTPLWQPSTAYAVGDYIKNSYDYVFYCSEAGISDPTNEPVFVNSAAYNGTARFFDAMNDNAIAVGGSNVFVFNMEVPSASDKGITNQSPGSSNVHIFNNLVGSTNHDGVEVKGNQGDASTLTIKDVFILRNRIVDAGRIAIEVTQPTFGVNPIENVVIEDNVVLSSGTRQPLTWEGVAQTHHAIKVFRAAGLKLSTNRIVFSEGLGVTATECTDVTGDITVEVCTNIGVNLSSNTGMSLTKVHTKQVGAGFAAVRENGCSGTLRYGDLIVEGAGHDYAFEQINAVSTARRYADSVQLAPGTSGIVNGELPVLPARAMTSGNVDDLVHSSGSEEIPASGTKRVTILQDTSSGGYIIGGSVNGQNGLRVQIAVDGKSSFYATADVGKDSADDTFTVVTIPPVTWGQGIEVIINNNTTGTKTFGWSIWYVPGNA